MTTLRVVEEVDNERIYQHVLKIEGPRHPIDALEKLNEAADYISSEFKEYGLQVSEQRFKVEGFDATFRNVEGAIGDKGDAELLIVSHYDTVWDSPGANDNGSGVATMLESARVLAQGCSNIPPVRFISFTLEERNPSWELRSRRDARSLGLIDRQNRFSSSQTHRLMKRVLKLRTKSLAAGKTLLEALEDARTRLQSELSESEIEYLRRNEERCRGVTVTSWLGKTALLGSGFWVEEAIRANRQILGAVNLETMGYTSSKNHSQTLPEGVNPTMFLTHKIPDIAIGNFIAVVGDANSDRLAQSFCRQCMMGSVDLPYACLQVPLRFEDIAKLGLHDLLRSDHASFWRGGIPSLLVTDTANFRYPFYHTRADTIDKLDFKFMEKVCRAIIAMTVDYAAA